MCISIPFDEAEELVELSLDEQSLLCHESVNEPVECSQNQHANTDFDSIMLSFVKHCDKAMASTKKCLAKINSVKQRLVKAIMIAKAKCLIRRSARTHRSKSAAKSAASNSNNTDGGDPEPAPGLSVLLRIKSQPVFSSHTEFTAPLSQEGA